MEATAAASHSDVAQTVQKVNNNAPAAKNEAADKPYLAKLEVLGADHPLTKFLGGFWKNVDVEA